MKLFFDGPDGIVFVQEVSTLEEAMSIIPTIIVDKIHYYRCWNSELNGDTAVCIDYGSHNYFFYATGGQI